MSVASDALWPALWLLALKTFASPAGRGEGWIQAAGLGWRAWSQVLHVTGRRPIPGSSELGRDGVRAKVGREHTRVVFCSFLESSISDLLLIFVSLGISRKPAQTIMGSFLVPPRL